MAEYIIHLKDAEEISTALFPSGRYPFETFNPVQSAVFPIRQEDCNAVIAASTSAGKTILSELFADHSIRNQGKSMIYLAPLRALVTEKKDDWTNPNHPFSDCKISVLSGDYKYTEDKIDEVNDSQIIIMTSEMLNHRIRNSSTRKSEYLERAGTLVVDESHLLTVPGRGVHLEVALMKFTEIYPECRILLLSATMNNVKSLAKWLNHLNKKKTYILESTYRPQPLKVHFNPVSDDFGYDNQVRQMVEDSIALCMTYCDDKFLIFVHTKKVGNHFVSEFKKNGINAVFHNADLNMSDRKEIENNFKSKSKNCRVIVATSTLAWGCYAHGSRLIGPDARLLNVENVNVGDELLCPVNNSFENRKVIRVKDFESKGYFVSLETGEEMYVSTEHLFFSARNRNAPAWELVTDLKKGDYIATPANLGLYDESTVEFNRLWYLFGFGFGDGCLCDVGVHADGSQKAMLDFCLGKDDPHEALLVSMFNDEFGIQPSVKHDSNNVSHLNTKKKSVVDRFLEILPLGRKNGCDDISPRLYGEKTRIVNFLRGWFDADGGMENHSNGNQSVGLSCISKSAIESARTILLAFGIRSSFGKKRMKDGLICGRFQPARREFSYRLRIFGYDNITRFKDIIGFVHVEKNNRLQAYLNSISKDKVSKDIVPARNLIRKHISVNSLSARKLGIDPWNAENKQDCFRSTLLNVLDKSTIKTELNELVDLPYHWSRIKEIKPSEVKTFREIEIEDPHAYVGNNAISHNCNLPARRVIIAGTIRGRQAVENYDIQQMMGRAGRKGFDPQGDVYIFVPASKQRVEIDRIQSKCQIDSHTLDIEQNIYRELSFHLVGEFVKRKFTKNDVIAWHSRSFSCFEGIEIHTITLTETLNKLKELGLVKYEDNMYEVTNLGSISVYNYMCPFVVAALKINFNNLFTNNLQNNFLDIAFALANHSGFFKEFLSKEDESKIPEFVDRFRTNFGTDISGGIVKAAYIYHTLLTGATVHHFHNLLPTIKFDFERVAGVLKQIDSRVTKWNKSKYFDNVANQIRYGVPAHLIPLVGIPGIGAVRAKRLYDSGFKTADDVRRNLEFASQVAGVKIK